MAKRKSQRKRSKQRHTYRRTSNFTQALKRLRKLKSNEQRQAIGMANDAFIRHLCKELQLLKHAKLTGKKRQALRKHRKQLQRLISNRTSMNKRRHILSQKGGGILRGILSAIPIVGGLYDLISGS